MNGSNNDLSKNIENVPNEPRLDTDIIHQRSGKDSNAGEANSKDLPQKRKTPRPSYCCSFNRSLLCVLTFLLLFHQFYQYHDERVGNLGGYTIATKEMTTETGSQILEHSAETTNAPAKNGTGLEASVKETTTAPAQNSTSSESSEKAVLKAARTIRPITAEIKQEQLKNYRIGKGFLINFHPTHHGGTSFCGIVGRSGGSVASKKYPEIAPDFACWFDKAKIGDDKYSPYDQHKFLRTTPIQYNETGSYIKAMRSHFHMTSWEYDGVDEMEHNISDTNWEHPELVSVVITRDPISRMLAGGHYIGKWYPGYLTGGLSHAGWWDYASNPRRQQTDNFFLRMLEGTRRKSHSYRRKLNKREKRKKKKARQKHRTYMYTDSNLPSINALRGDFEINEKHYENAITLLNQFTVVLDIACLDDGFNALAKLLSLNMTYVTKTLDLMARKRNDGRKKDKNAFKKLPHEERIGYSDVYEYLVEKNQFDIKLYEYSKTISLVDCNS